MDIRDYIGQIQSTVIPPQGMTSTVTLYESERGRFALKRSTQPPFIDWLKREAHVLQALESTVLSVPRCIALDVQPDAASLLMTALLGEPLSVLLRRGVSDELRHDLLRQFGRTLQAIHRTPIPAALRAERPWLDRILDEARDNLERGYAEPDAPPINRMVTFRPKMMPDTLIHGDYTIDNVLVSAGQITGVIDWGRGDVGDQRYDLALAIRPMEPESAFLTEPDFAALYAGYAGDRMTVEDHDWFYNLYAYF